MIQQTQPTTALHPAVAQALEFTEVYKAHRDAHPALREAACLRVQYPWMLGPIEDDDLLAGGRGQTPMLYVGTMWWATMSHKRGPAKQGGYCFDFSAQQKWGQSDADREAIEQIEAFWRQEHTCAKGQARLPEDQALYARGGGQQITGGEACGFCVALDLDRLVQLGIPGLQAAVEQGLARAQAGQGDEDFFRGLGIALEVLVDVCEHYRRQAQALAQQARDAQDRARLDRIAASLEAIVRRPPGSLHEAMQLLWLVDLIASGKHIEAFRIDVALGDWYAHDIDRGVLSDTQAQDLVDGLWRLWAKHGDPAVCRMTIGGRGRRNEANADRFCLAAMEATRRHHGRIPQLSLRLYEGQDPALEHKAFDVIGEGCVFPVLYNDDVIVPGVAKALRVPAEDAAEYQPLGCGEYMIGGKSPSLLNFGWSVPQSFTAALRGGVDETGRRLGPDCPPISDQSPFEQIEENLRAQVEFAADLAARCHAANNGVLGEQCAFLWASLLNDDCLSRGRSLMAGGVRYVGACIMGHGFTNAADALVAIRTLVFERRSVKMSELLTALEADFEGHETLLKQLTDQPKYGNDAPAPDAELVKLWNMMSDACDRAGQRHGLDFLTLSSVNPGGYQMGACCGATADGRRKGSPFAIGNAPTAGNDTRGLTALLNSLSKVDAANGGSVSNVKLAKSLFARNRPKLEALFDVYWKRGGIQASVSVVDQEQLRDAMAHPQRYPHLLVRLGGWTARFVELERDQQEEVIRRSIY